MKDLNLDQKSTQCVYKHNYNTKNYSYKTFINKNMFKDPTLPRIKNIKCPYAECEANTQGKEKEVIYIKCSKSDKEVYIKGKDFYVRSGPSTDKLEGKDLVEYTKTTFS